MAVQPWEEFALATPAEFPFNPQRNLIFAFDSVGINTLTSRRGRKVPRSIFARAGYSFALIALVVAIGTVGIHELEGLSYLDSFYFTAMLATGEGPNFVPATVGGKIFAGLMAFVSVGAVITSLLFLFGPFFGSVFKLGLEKIEEEAEKEKERIEHRG